MRRLPLLLTALVACSRPSAPDCPPPTIEPATDAPEPTADAPAPEPAAALPSKPEALSVKADDGHELRLWALRPAGGGDDRRAVVLLHGRTWSSVPDFALLVGEDTSLSLMHALAEQGVAAYALDLRGYGETARDASGWATPVRAAEDLAAALAYVKDQEGEAPDLLGWSLGSLVALLAVQRHPEAARSLALYGYPRDVDGRAPDDKDAGEPAKAANTEQNARSDFITEGAITKQAIDAYVAASLAADPIRVDWKDMHEFNVLDPAAIAIPTLVIHGVHDPIARQLWQAKLFTRMSVEDRQWVVIPNADHAAHLEQPEDFLRALLGFWDVAASS